MKVFVKKTPQERSDGIPDSGNMVLGVNSNSSDYANLAFAKKCQQKFYPKRSNEDLRLIDYGSFFSYGRLEIMKQDSELSTPTYTTLDSLEVHAEFYDVYRYDIEHLIDKVFMSPESKDILSLSTMASRRELSYLMLSSPPHHNPQRLARSCIKTIHCSDDGKTIIYLTDYDYFLKILNDDDNYIHTIDFRYLRHYVFSEEVHPIFFNNAVSVKDGIILTTRVDYDLDELWLYHPESHTIFSTGIELTRENLSIGHDSLVSTNSKGEIELLDLHTRSMMNYQNACAVTCRISHDGSTIIFKTKNKSKDIHYYNRRTDDHIILKDALIGGVDEEIALSPDGKLIATMEYRKNNSYLTIIFVEEKRYSTFNFSKSLVTQVQISSDNNTLCFLMLPSKRAKYGDVHLLNFTS